MRPQAYIQILEVLAESYPAFLNPRQIEARLGGTLNKRFIQRFLRQMIDLGFLSSELHKFDDVSSIRKHFYCYRLSSEYYEIFSFDQSLDGIFNFLNQSDLKIKSHDKCCVELFFIFLMFFKLHSLHSFSPTIMYKILFRHGIKLNLPSIRHSLRIYCSIGLISKKNNTYVFNKNVIKKICFKV